MNFFHFCISSQFYEQTDSFHGLTIKKRATAELPTSLAASSGIHMTHSFIVWAHGPDWKYSLDYL